MSVELNHTIVWCRDKGVSADFLVQVLGRPAAKAWGPFLIVDLDNNLSMDYHATDDPITPQHYAFLIGESDFDAVESQLAGRSIEHWADPGCHSPGINRNDGGRGTYFRDPDGHLLEVITRPYGLD